MSILDDDIFEKAERPITIGILKNVKDEDIPALHQAWYDFFFRHFMCMPCNGAKAYEMLSFYADCVPLNTYRRFYPSGISQIAGKNCVYIKPLSSREEIIKKWENIAMGRIETEFFNSNAVHWTLTRFTDMFVGLTGVYGSKELENGDFRKEHVAITKFNGTDIEYKTIPSEEDPTNKYRYFLNLINELYSEI